MSEPRDPLRLLDARDAALVELESGLREARAQGPSEAQSARMRAALGLPASVDATRDGAPSDAVPSPAGSAPVLAGAAKRLWLKLLVVVSLGLGLSLVALRVLRDERDAAVVSAPARERTSPQAQLAESRVVVEPPAPTERPAKSAAEVAQASAAKPPAGRRAPVQRAAEPAAEVATDTVAELALLKRAKAHAHSAPQRALALLAEHEQRFARGAFVQEREVITIEALLASGKRAAAAQRAAHFFARFPDSAHGRRVQALLDATDSALSDAKRELPPHPVR